MADKQKNRKIMVSISILALSAILILKNFFSMADARHQPYALIVLGAAVWMVLSTRSKGKATQQRWTQQWAMALIKWLGWKINNMTHPTAWKKAVVVLAPHTSNWDFFYGMLFKFSHPYMNFRFAIKKEVMFFPLSHLMKALGAIPIDRHQTTSKGRANMVSVMTNMLNDSDSILLAIAPEGTRSYAKRWKTGFYKLSEATNLPIILGYMHYAKKEMGLGPTFHPTSDMEKDIAHIQDFYRKIAGKYPEQGVV